MQKILPVGVLLVLLTGMPAPAAEQRIIVAVFDIEDRGTGQKPETLLTLAEFIVVRLTEGGYQVVPRDQLRERLREQKKESYQLCYDQSCQIELGRELAAQKSLSTQLIKVGERCHVVSVLYDLEKSATDKAAKVEAACTEEALLGAVDRAVTQLVGAAPTPPAPPTGPETKTWFISLRGGGIVPLGGKLKITNHDTDITTFTEPNFSGIGQLRIDRVLTSWFSIGVCLAFGGGTSRQPSTDRDYGYWISLMEVTISFGYDLGPVDLRGGGAIGMHTVGGEVESELSRGGGAVVGLGLGGFLEGTVPISSNIGIVLEIGMRFAPAVSNLEYAPVLYAAAGVEYGW